MQLHVGLELVLGPQEALQLARLLQIGRLGGRQADGRSHAQRLLRLVLCSGAPHGGGSPAATAASSVSTKWLGRTQRHKPIASFQHE